MQTLLFFFINRDQNSSTSVFVLQSVEVAVGRCIFAASPQDRGRLRGHAGYKYALLASCTKPYCDRPELVSILVRDNIHQTYSPCTCTQKVSILNQRPVNPYAAGGKFARNATNTKKLKMKETLAHFGIIICYLFDSTLQQLSSENQHGSVWMEFKYKAVVLLDESSLSF